MAELDFETAKNLAGYLVTIGHPYSAVAIEGTALDLMDWCKGVIIKGRIFSPAKQAEDLVNEARTTWKEGWPEKGGTLQLLALFRRMYFPPEPEFKVFESPPPTACNICGDTGWQTFERNGYEFSRTCKGCGGKTRRAATLCPDCSGKETKLVMGRREPCNTCLTPERRQEISEWLKQKKESKI